MGKALGHAILADASPPPIFHHKRRQTMSAPSAPTVESPALSFRAPAPALPRLLAGIPSRGAMALQEHLAVHGEMPGAHGRGRRHARERGAMLIDEIERSGLLGHGGAG